MQNKEICWNITSRCNQNCNYCHRFLNIPELFLRENKIVLVNLIKNGVTHLTWTGGEPLLYEGINELIKMADDNNIKNNLITNGMLLDPKRLHAIIPYLDSITFSLDSINIKINELLGRGKNHTKKIDKILHYLEMLNNPIKVRINTVITPYNIASIDHLITYLSKFKIYCWRIFKFMPLRETAAKKKLDFLVSDKDFEEVKKNILRKTNINRIEFRIQNDMESKYILIIANGDIIVTSNGIDKKVGNALIKNLDKLNNNIN